MLDLPLVKPHLQNRNRKRTKDPERGRAAVLARFGACSVAPPPLPPSHLKDKTRTREASKRDVLFTPMERQSERQCNWDAAGVEMKK